MAFIWRFLLPMLCLTAGPAAALTLEGSVTDLHGRAVEGVRAELRQMPSNFAIEQALLTHRLATLALDGGDVLAQRWSLTAPGAGVYQVRLEAPGHLSLRARMIAITGDRSLPPARLRPAQMLTVTVNGPHGRPVAGTGVWASSASPEMWTGEHDAGWSPALRLAWTDQRGKVRLPHLIGERLRLQILPPAGFAAAGIETGDDVQITVVAQKYDQRSVAPR